MKKNVFDCNNVCNCENCKNPRLYYDSRCLNDKNDMDFNSLSNNQIVLTNQCSYIFDSNVDNNLSNLFINQNITFTDSDVLEDSEVLGVYELHIPEGGSFVFIPNDTYVPFNLLRSVYTEAMDLYPVSDNLGTPLSPVPYRSIYFSGFVGPLDVVVRYEFPNVNGDEGNKAAYADIGIFIHRPMSEPIPIDISLFATTNKYPLGVNNIRRYTKRFRILPEDQIVLMMKAAPRQLGNTIGVENTRIVYNIQILRAPTF
ncbi:MAG: hypothetical protein Hyperionvirus6_73 [Hyperionvirus sp.]|uniref:Uncharacterized protein n=1 Tax=Hyperionvirus sp. TaxID=2487770 RepID=A0A3G5A8J9_9VIRU|nr:MAG: hypothetical protein Hyperionvirus6_73 [Hyperionvirus sp.]